ncbi:MAG: IS1 family transposase [Bacteroidota bacterium]
MECIYCKSECIKYGKQKSGEQRYQCKLCKRTQQEKYRYNAYKPLVNEFIRDHVKEGSGIRSIGRLLKISPITVMRRILSLSISIQRPMLSLYKNYEVDELCTYIGKKTRKRWVAYALRKDTKEVADFVVGTRTLLTLKKITDPLILSEASEIYTDGLNIYKNLLYKKNHIVKRYKINHIERMNLTLRTHLKRLSRRTICYSKSLIMLNACLKIYFWG